MEELKQYQIGKKGMLAWLDDIEAKDNIAISLYLPLKSAGTSDTIRQPEFELPDALIRRIETSHTGAALLYSQKMLYVLLPPFPVPQSLSLNRCDVSPLRDLFKNEYTCAILMIRLGAYTIAVTQGETLLTAKAGTGNIHARHRQGGSSSRRFARHRDKQIETFFTRICEHAREIIEPYAGQIHYVILDGEDHTIRSFREQCRFIETHSSLILDRKLNIREPRRSSLDKAIYNLWSTTIIEWPVPQR
ncbi:MAG TPA: hypothetical protein DCX22_04480 [Dehalococcoidia bacterium]|nr:hypothetical protein [Dehalococcoidia bacterium]